MSWIIQPAKTYDNLRNEPELLKNCSMPLVPLSHTVQNAHVEIVLNEDGEPINIVPLSKDKGLTVVPCTDGSASRGKGDFPHMLYDNLKYLSAEAAKIDSKYKNKYITYCKQLKEWCEDPDCPREAKIIYSYISKGTIISDLEKERILTVDGGKLKWICDSDNKPSDCLSTFVRFKVEYSGGGGYECNHNTILQNSYSEFDRKKYSERKLCYATGEEQLISYKHHTKLRYSADKAKLISANDDKNFTYRGRFKKAEDAVAVGFEVSQKAHSALRWLIKNQGFATGDQTAVIWTADCCKIPQPQEDTESIFGEEEEKDIYTPLKSYANKIRLAINSYNSGADFADFDLNNVNVMIVEAATPGRLSIVYYTEIDKTQYLENIRKWHTECIWNHSYKFEEATVNEEGKREKSRKHIRFTGAASILDIIFAAYGNEVNGKFKKHLVEILISCVVEGRRLPKDLMLKAVERVSNPQQIKRGSNSRQTENWELHKRTSIACALIRKYYIDYKKEEYDMALDYANEDRSYLFGRVLAFAERIEEVALFKANAGKRIPNARKLRNKFRLQPAKTLMILDDKLEPYVEKLYASGGWLYNEMQSIMALIDKKDFMDNTPLSPLYLLGYACQTAELKKKKETETEQDNI